jgi:protein-disulfide isomerase
MLEVSMLQSFELINFVEIWHFSTEIVEKPSNVSTLFRSEILANAAAKFVSLSDKIEQPYMKHFCNFLLFAVVIFFSHANAQRPDEVLATSTGMTYSAASLTPDGQKLFSEQRRAVADTRTRLLSETISDLLLELESKAQNSTPEKLLAIQQAKVPEPTATEIQAVYNANSAALAGRPLAEVRPQIVEFLKDDSEHKAVDGFIQTLRAKHKVIIGKDVNGVGLGPLEVLATVGVRTITAREFEQTNLVRLNDIEMQIYEELKSDLESSIFSALVAEEAKARNLDSSGFLAVEITDKLREFTDEERAGVEDELMRRLFTKYNAKILIREPTPLVQTISVDDDPQLGNPAAPVTVVMFTDFQCPGCSRTHPALKKALAGYGDRVRFVIRDFPLEKVHNDSFQAALAANAARAQGKFAEYIEILYRNQGALDKASLAKYAVELGLNVKQFELDFSDARTAAEVRKDQADGRSYGIYGTPTIFVNGVKVHRLSLSGFRSAIDRALKK